MKNVLLLFVFAMGIFTITNAQTIEELTAQKADKDALIGTLKGESVALAAQIDALAPFGWKTGAAGTIGFNLNGFNNWLQKGDPNTSATTLGVSGNLFAHLLEDKYFWRNGLNLNLGWLKFTNDDDPALSNDEFQNTADVLGISSLFGYKLNDKWAASALGEYRSSIINNFNNPAYLDIGVGATWTPYESLVVVFHPLNYNFVIADDDVAFESSLGCKIVADYNQSLPMGVSWKSNLSAFLSYSSVPDFSNWTWVNGLNFTAWKGIGVGFELGLRGNKQESFNSVLNDPTILTKPAEIGDLEENDNKLQTYWLLGLTYSIAR